MHAQTQINPDDITGMFSYNNNVVVLSLAYTWLAGPCSTVVHWQQLSVAVHHFNERACWSSPDSQGGIKDSPSREIPAYTMLANTASQRQKG